MQYSETNKNLEYHLHGIRIAPVAKTRSLFLGIIIQGVPGIVAFINNDMKQLIYV
jgi:hypothetical protein